MEAHLRAITASRVGIIENDEFSILDYGSTARIA